MAANSSDAMRDEYGTMDSSGKIYTFPSAFQLESGQTLLKPQICFNTWGTLNAARDNVMVVCHALTGNSRLDNWWGELLGPGKAFDTTKYLVVCANILGSCYGSTGPTSIDPQTKMPYKNNFPCVTIRDTVRLQICMIKEAIGAVKVAVVIGGSFGGMQALEWCLLGGKEFVGRCVAIACNASHSAWQIGISEVQRQSIYADEKWRGGNFPDDDPPLRGLSVARQIAMITYRSHVAFDQKFAREFAPSKSDKTSATSTKDPVFGVGPNWQVRSYLEHQGTKFLTRFDPLTYVRLTEQMDTHDVGRGRGGIEAALSFFTQPCLVIGLDSDVLYPLPQQQQLAQHLPLGQLVVVHTVEGHDGFLLEQDQVNSAILTFLSASLRSAL
eukprot:c6769_g1_i1.p1 GENE.c6769_g1_i1~~c6769_g1_i1.p1  ORF type:complete len:384 (-),score=81.53 c6769_g1_i1:144-1295(-)